MFGSRNSGAAISSSVPDVTNESLVESKPDRSLDRKIQLEGSNVFSGGKHEADLRKSSGTFSLPVRSASGLRGPEGTVYCDGLFTLKIQIPERYPFQPPNVTFVTPIYHPNIDNGGRICLDILNLPPKGAWQPSLNISTVMMSIGLLLSEPNPDDGLMAEASREFKYNRKVFDEKARDWTKRYANPLAAANYIDNSTFPNMNMEATQPLSISMNPQSEGSTKEILSDKPVDVTEGKRKKLKLSLKSVTPFRNISSENIENIAPTGSIKEVDEKMPKENCEEVEENSVDVRMIIVSDSEESDQEIDDIYRSRFPLLRKRTVPKRSD